ncbi:MAG TPA: hypothetical protein VKY74_22475, partial [Chloroflexia bacterium]|nr:hypothetical protein [Chloroflexia bacterium]
MPDAPAAEGVGTIVLQEFAATEAPLTPAMYDLLRTRYSGQIEITRTDQPDIYRLAARQHVGRIAIPGGRMLVIRPKVGVANLFYMLTADPRLAHFTQPPADLAPNPEIFSFVLAMLVQRIEHLVNGGLLHGYMPQEAD